jgi:hypothetical protein
MWYFVKNTPCGLIKISIPDLVVFVPGLLILQKDNFLWHVPKKFLNIVPAVVQDFSNPIHQSRFIVAVAVLNFSLTALLLLPLLLRMMQAKYY